uniref:Mobilization protein A n=2 Tax=Escherichia coli TaxID=562 RepID=MOBA1_ECOLX|nr:RecName: Full=Mobilization protein A; Short=Protein B [Escherichia coli]CAA28152.1 unnamed protein product [Escherichia coli]
MGLSHKERREYGRSYKRDNNRTAPFSCWPRWIRPGGWSGHGGMSGTTRTGVTARLAFWGGWLSPCLSRAGEKPSCVRTSTRTQIITCCSRLTCSGLPGARAGWLSGLCWRGSGVLLLDGHFAAADEAVNRKLNRRAGAQPATGEMTDVRQPAFRGAGTVNALARFFHGRGPETAGVFLGKDEQGEPVLVPRDTWRKTNIQILGLPGSGKSVMATNALIRSVRDFGDAVVYFDQRGPVAALLPAHCPNFTLLDLRPGKPAQLNLFRDLDQYALKNLLVAGFNLSETGHVADHYRISEQKAAKLIAEQVSAGGKHSAGAGGGVRAAGGPEKGREGADHQAGERGRPERPADGQRHRRGGDNQRRRLLYVIGSMDDEAVIRVQKMLFARCAQIIIARDEFRRWPHASIMLDEIKYLLSKYVLNALGTVRSRDCNLRLAHHAGRLRAAGQDLPADFVKTTVLDNTPIRWFYRAASQESRSGAGQTGEIRVDVERRGPAGRRGTWSISAGTASSRRSRPLFDVNTLQHLLTGSR